MGTTTVNKSLTLASAQVGTTATNTKQCKYNNWYYGGVVSGSCYDWCEVFVQWVFAQLGASELLHGKTANCGVQAAQFKAAGELVYNKDYSALKASQVKAGDVALFHWSNSKSTCCPGVYSCDHVGIVKKVNSNGTITTIEGNTGSNPNGAVMERTRSLSVVSCVGRPKYSGTYIEPTPPAPVQIPDILYRVRAGGKWLKEVHNMSSYAGTVGKAITDIAIKATSGRIKYRVHIKGGKWLDWVTGYNLTDHENGYAGDLKPIDAVQVYYYTPADLKDSLGYTLRAEYRVSPLKKGYLPYQFDLEKDSAGENFAGELGWSIDRLQIALSK